jgi:hypothetical protein
MKKTALLIYMWFLPAACLADTIYLNDGQVFVGDVIYQDQSTVTVESYNGDRENIDMRYVRSIARGDNYQAYRRKMRQGFERNGRWTGDELIFKLGVDFDGRHETSNSSLFIEGSGASSVDGTQNVNSGLLFGGEYVYYVTRNLGLGGGVVIGSVRGLSGVAGNFSFMPIYGLFKARLTPGRNNLYEYFIGQVGYNLFSGDHDYRGAGGSLDGGLYVGAGIGIAIGRIEIEALYSENRGKAKNSGFLTDPVTGAQLRFNESGDIKYSKMALNVGFIF